MGDVVMKYILVIMFLLNPETEPAIIHALEKGHPLTYKNADVCETAARIRQNRFERHYYAARISTPITVFYCENARTYWENKGEELADG